MLSYHSPFLLKSTFHLMLRFCLLANYYRQFSPCAGRCRCGRTAYIYLSYPTFSFPFLALICSRPVRYIHLILAYPSFSSLPFFFSLLFISLLSLTYSHSIFFSLFSSLCSSSPLSAPLLLSLFLFSSLCSSSPLSVPLLSIILVLFFSLSLPLTYSASKDLFVLYFLSRAISFYLLLLHRSGLCHRHSLQCKA